MRKEKGVPALISQFLKDEGMTSKQLAASLYIAESTVHRWLLGRVRPTGTAAAILWTLVALSHAKASPVSAEEKAPTPHKGKTRSGVVDATDGITGAGATMSEVVAGGMAGGTDRKLRVLASATMGLLAGALDQAILNDLENRFQQAGIPFEEGLGSVATGLTIYRLLKKRIEKETLTDEDVRAFDEKLRAFEKTQRHLRKISILEAQLKVEQEKLEKLTVGA